MSFWVDVLGWMPSRLSAVPNGAGTAFASGGNAGNARIAPGTPASCFKSALGSRYTHFRFAAAALIVESYLTTVTIMLTALGTEITCGTEQSSVSGTPAAAFATS